MIKPNRITQILAGIFVCFLVCSLLIFPITLTLIPLLSNSPKPLEGWPTTLQQIAVYAMAVVGMAWYFFLGGSIASFLNVVALRIPCGQTITGSSACPQCHQPLKFWDKIPVYSWCRFGGRCHHCQFPIPFRYLAVELILGGLFVLLPLGLAQRHYLAVDGGSLGLNQIGFLTERMLAPTIRDSVYLLYNYLLISTLFLFALVDHQRSRLTLRWLLIPLAVAGLIAFLHPAVIRSLFYQTDQTEWGRLIPFWGEFSNELNLGSSNSRLDTMVSQLIGTLAGGVISGIAYYISWLGWRPNSRADSQHDSRNDRGAVDRHFLQLDSQLPQPTVNPSQPSANQVEDFNQVGKGNLINGNNMTLGLMVIGFFHGWQAVLVAFLASTLLLVVSDVIGRIIILMFNCSTQPHPSPTDKLPPSKELAPTDPPSITTNIVKRDWILPSYFHPPPSFFLLGVTVIMLLGFN